MSDAVSVVWDDALLGYTMGGDHPLHPVRLDLTMRLADSLGVLRSDRLELLKPTPADVELLTLVHDPAYLEAVRRAEPDLILQALRSGVHEFIVSPPDPKELAGMFRTEYQGRTLRDHYGLPRPANRLELTTR